MIDHMAEDEKVFVEDDKTFKLEIGTPPTSSLIKMVLGIEKGSGEAGTVVAAEDIPRAIDEAKKGRVEFRLDKDALIHAPIRKASFEEDQLMDNLTTLVDTILRGRPSGVKGQFLRSAFLTSTMGPSVPIDIAGIMDLRVE